MPPPMRLSHYLSSEEIRKLTEIPKYRPLLDIVAIWGAVLMALAAYYHMPSVPVFILCFIVIASRQLAMTHVVHDASHYRLFRSRGWNDWLSDLLVAGPVMISTQSYRVQHLPHHQYLGERALDSDQRTWYCLRGWQFVRRTVLTLLGWEALVTFGSYARATGESQTDSAATGGLPRRLACTALGNAAIALYCLWLGNVLLYLWLWFIPMFTLTMYLLVLRVIAEHQTVAYSRQGIDRADQDFTPPLIRTIRPRLLGKLLLGPMNFYYHHEHHLAPAIPYARLPEVHRMLCERNYFRDHPQALGDSYFATLKLLVFPGEEVANVG